MSERALFELLNLTQETYNDCKARENYLKIIRAIHPDRNPSPDAPRVTAAVVRAYNILTTTDKRLRYIVTGQPEKNVTCDNKEAQELAALMRQLYANSYKTATNSKTSKPQQKKRKIEYVVIDSDSDSDYSSERTTPERASATDTDSPPSAGKTKKTYVDASTSPIYFRNESSSPRRGNDLPKRNLNNDGWNPNNSSRRRSSLKEYIMDIKNLRSRAEGVRFTVIWGPGGHETTEPADIVLEEKRGLMRWLDKLAVEAPRKYNAILKFHPEFKTVL